MNSSNIDHECGLLSEWLERMDCVENHRRKKLVFNNVTAVLLRGLFALPQIPTHSPRTRRPLVRSSSSFDPQRCVNCDSRHRHRWLFVRRLAGGWMDGRIRFAVGFRNNPFTYYLVSWRKDGWMIGDECLAGRVLMAMIWPKAKRWGKPLPSIWIFIFTAHRPWLCIRVPGSLFNAAREPLHLAVPPSHTERQALIKERLNEWTNERTDEYNEKYVKGNGSQVVSIEISKLGRIYVCMVCIWLIW